MRVLRPETVQLIADMEMSLCAHDEPTVPSALVREWMDALADHLGPLPAPTEYDKLRRQLCEQVTKWLEIETNERTRAADFRAQLSRPTPYRNKPVPYVDAFLEASARECAATSNTLLRVRDVLQLMLRSPR